MNKYEELKSIEKVLEEYKDKAFDFKQPALFELLKLSRENPNDADFGLRVRELVNKAQAHHKEIISDMNKVALKNILTHTNKSK